MRSSWFLGALLLALPAQAAEFFVPKPQELVPRLTRVEVFLQHPARAHGTARFTLDGEPLRTEAFRPSEEGGLTTYQAMLSDKVPPGMHRLTAFIETVKGYESTEATFYIAGQNPVDASCALNTDCRTLFCEPRMVPRDHGDESPHVRVRFQRRTTAVSDMKQVFMCGRPHSLGESCTQALDCDSRFCSLDQFKRNGVCTQQQAVGGLCFSQNECSTGFCDNGHCAPRPPPDPHEHEDVKTAVRRTRNNLLRGTILRR